MTYFFIEQNKSRMKFKSIMICDNFDLLNVVRDNYVGAYDINILTDINVCEDMNANELTNYIKEKIKSSNIYELSSLSRDISGVSFIVVQQVR